MYVQKRIMLDMCDSFSRIIRKKLMKQTLDTNHWVKSILAKAT